MLQNSAAVADIVDASSETKLATFRPASRAEVLATVEKYTAAVRDFGGDPQFRNYYLEMIDAFQLTDGSKSALARWIKDHKPNGGLLSTADFQKMAENLGFIAESLATKSEQSDRFVARFHKWQEQSCTSGRVGLMAYAPTRCQRPSAPYVPDTTPLPPNLFARRHGPLPPAWPPGSRPSPRPV